ncbi:MAG: nucleotidyltransferase domain-containing protein [Balneolaceae bacterium]|nr:MAG: nucleotidyltransferase domain-containing protein [Balneolaceae bacterium]
MIDVSPEHMEIIRDILRKRVPECEVRAYGSRVSGKSRHYSDLDLAVAGTEKLDRDTVRLLKEDFENSSLPFRVDVLDLHQIDESFRKIIEKECEMVQ